jgi:hypothetical protein
MSQKYAHLDVDRFVIGFYADDFHEAHQIPAGAVEIDDEHHVALLEGQSVGKRMKLDAKGQALLVDPAPPTSDELATALRGRRDAALAATDWLVSRHQDETLFSAKTTLTKAQGDALGAYRKALRDLPAVKAFPSVDLPAAPDFIGA